MCIYDIIMMCLTNSRYYCVRHTIYFNTIQTSNWFCTRRKTRFACVYTFSINDKLKLIIGDCISRHFCVYLHIIFKRRNIFSAYNYCNTDCKLYINRAWDRFGPVPTTVYDLVCLYITILYVHSIIISHYLCAHNCCLCARVTIP